jgi:hypothetical protein
MRSEPAIRRDRREASEPCRSAPARWHRHGAMRSGSAGDATASPRPPASRADAASDMPGETRRSMRSERDTRRRGRDASETGAVDKLVQSARRGVANRRSEGIVVKRASRADQHPKIVASRIGRGVARWSSHSAMTAKRARRCDGAPDRSWHRRGVAGSGNATALPCRERAVPIRQRGAIDRKVSPMRRDGARCPGAPPRAT